MGSALRNLRAGRGQPLDMFTGLAGRKPSRPTENSHWPEPGDVAGDLADVQQSGPIAEGTAC